MKYKEENRHEKKANVSKECKINRNAWKLSAEGPLKRRSKLKLEKSSKESQKQLGIAEKGLKEEMPKSGKKKALDGGISITGKSGKWQQVSLIGKKEQVR